MRILRLYPFLPPLPGGMEKHVLRLTQEQRRLGCCVRVVFSAGEASAPTDIRVLQGWPLRQLPLGVAINAIFFCAVLLSIMRSRVRADAVHVHGDWSAFLLGRLVARACGARLRVASAHGMLRKGAWAPVYRFALRTYEVVYCTGAMDARYLRSAGVPNVRFQNSGVDALFFEDASTRGHPRNDVVCVASLVPVKNIALVLDIARAMPQRRFLVIGDGPLRRCLEERQRSLGIDNVRFAGHLEPSAISRELRAARVFLSTSFSEGTPTALLEAMACGLPVVTSRSNDFCGVVEPGRNGFVVDAFEPAPYLDVLTQVLEDALLARSMSATNRADAQRHRWQDIASRITDWMRAQLERATGAKDA